MDENFLHQKRNFGNCLALYKHMNLNIIYYFLINHANIALNNNAQILITVNYKQAQTKPYT